MDLGGLHELFWKRTRRSEGMKSRSSNLNQSVFTDLSSSCSFAYLSSHDRRRPPHQLVLLLLLLYFTKFNPDLLALTCAKVSSKVTILRPFHLILLYFTYIPPLDSTRVILACLPKYHRARAGSRCFLWIVRFFSPTLRKSNGQADMILFPTCPSRNGIYIGQPASKVWDCLV